MSSNTIFYNMKRIFVTWATGNIWSAVLKFLWYLNSHHEVIAWVREIAKAKKKLWEYKNISYTEFDFTKTQTFEYALDNITTIFLLRPPEFANIESQFKPFLEVAQKKWVKKVVFLSVQWAEKSPMIPHHKIEKLILDMNFEYIFMRPAYFIQNLIGSLLIEIQKNKIITLPAGKAKFNWIDVQNIAELWAIFLTQFEQYKNKAYTITGTENKNFYEIADVMTKVLNEKISYKSVNPLSFILKKKQQWMPMSFVFIMTILHLIPRFTSEPEILDTYKKITDKNPTTIREFIKRERKIFCI